MSESLGTLAVPGGTRFAVRARDAEGITLCLFDTEEKQIPMQREGEIFSAIAPVGAGARYGFRVEGAWRPEQGLLFDPAKLLIDPYAKLLDGRFTYDPRLGAPGIDTAALVPKALVPGPMPPAPPPLSIKPGGLIYELNVRGFSMRHQGVPPDLRGTVAALAQPAILAHLRKLQVGAVELMPIVAAIDERHLPPLGLHNAWGYNPVVPMALDPGLVPGGLDELASTITTLHDAGIAMILDLVFNHTGESDLEGPTLSFRGLDNRVYAKDGQGRLINYTGTGNMLDGADAAVQDVILDSLRHFASLGVDGFRFDLATVMARGPDFDPNAPLLRALAQDPLLKDLLMIAEPWDMGPGGYQLGHFPSSFLEWNDRYRDDVRRFWHGDGTAAVMATRLCGSSDIFSGPATRTVNYIAAHDGFTLADLVAYERKHNDANGENNHDGHDPNFSWNNGSEGPSGDPDILARRAADLRALIATLFASRGTIMLTAGDEFARTQQGNNNAYAQDNDITWLDWEGRDRSLEDFTAACAQMRARHAALSDTEFLQHADWVGLDGVPMSPEKWQDAGLAGFELHFGGVVIRIDRGKRECTVRGGQL